MSARLNHTTYSFLDLTGVIAYPFASYVFTGQGVGEVTIQMSGEKTGHEISTTGDVIIYKIPGNNGKLIISCQQTSNIHKFLLATYQQLYYSTAKEWGMMFAMLRNIHDGTEHFFKGLSFDTLPEKRYGAAGQMVLWVLLAADIRSTAPNPSGAGQMSAIARSFLPPGI